MEGISKEYLEKCLSVVDIRDVGRHTLLTLLIADCKELDPWLPIEGAPWNKPIKVYYPTMPEGLRQKIICRRVNWDSSLHKPTHYKELPPDPKE